MKKWILLILIIFTSIGYTQELYQEQPLRLPPPVKGLKNDISPEHLSAEYMSDCVNVDVNNDSISKRRSSQAYDNIQYSSGNVLDQWEHWQSDGNRYFLRVVGSTLSYSAGDGNWFVLISTLNPNYIPDNASFLGYNIITNGVDDVYFFKDGVVISSDTFTKFRYIDVWRERIVGAGVTDNRSILYYGTVNEIFNCAFNATYIGQGDGDIITGLYVKENLWIFKNYSIWTAIWRYVYGIDETTPEFVIKKLTDEFGCLYNTTIQDFAYGLMFFSHRGWIHIKLGEKGIESYRFASENIDGTLDGIGQIIPSQRRWYETTAVDFGAGTPLNVDTTTTPGSILLDELILVEEDWQTPDVYNSVYIHNVASQSFQSAHGYNYDVTFTTIMVKIANYYLGDVGVEILDASQVLLASQTISESDIHDSVPTWEIVNFANWNIAWTDATVYYLVLRSSVTQGFRWEFNINGGYDRGVGHQALSDFLFIVRGEAPDSLGHFTSQTKDAGSFWKSWGIFNADYTTPTDSSISWYVSCATATVFLSSYNLISVTPGYEINSTSGPYILWFASMSTTGIGQTPQIDRVIINWYESEAIDPIPSMVDNDGNYWAAITTPTMAKNGVVLKCDEDFVWTKYIYTEFYPYSMGMYRGLPYIGTNDGGETIRVDIDNTAYTDCGSAYDSWFRYGDLDCGYPDNEKDFKSAYIKAENSGNWNLSWGYAFNGSTRTITCDREVYLGRGDRIINCQDRLPKGSNAFLIKPQFQNNNAGEWYDYRGMNLYFTIDKRR